MGFAFLFSELLILLLVLPVKRILIFGNSGSGKSTLAKACSQIPGMSYLDLDTVAWKSDQPGVREDEVVSIEKLDAFSNASESWVAEGCYSGLISHLLPLATEIVFLNPGVDGCIANCRSRPWEAHKYASKEEQDKNLEMLIEWVRDYETRTDEFSLEAHRALFAAFSGPKFELKSNEEAMTFRNRFLD